MILGLAAGFCAHADWTLDGSLSLDADTDWRGRGVMTVPEGVTLNLNGYVLWVDAIAGGGTIAASSETQYQLADLTAPDASRASSPSTPLNSKYNASMAFDNSIEVLSFIFYQGDFKSGGIWNLDYDFGEATRVNCYRILGMTSQGAGPGYHYSVTRCPRNWTIQGSDDGETWTTVDEQSGQSFAVNEYKSYLFSKPSAAYRRYRLAVSSIGDDNDGRIQFYEMEYGAFENGLYIDETSAAHSDLSGLSVASGVTVFYGGNASLVRDMDFTALPNAPILHGTIDLCGHDLSVADFPSPYCCLAAEVKNTGAFDLTTPQGTVSSPNTFLTGPAAAFGDYAEWSSTQRLCANFSPDTPVSVVYDFADATVIDAYRLKLGSYADSAPYRAPRAWYFEGSNDNNAWTLLDRRPNETGWAVSEERQYEFVNDTAYRYYRITFTATASAPILEFFRLEYGCLASSGNVRVAVPQGKTAKNPSVAFSGLLRLVKDGPGTFVPSKTGQTNDGGVEIKAGVLKCGADDYTTLGKAGSAVVVRENGTFDFDGKYNYIDLDFILDGGTIANTGADMTDHAQLARLKLTKDSVLAPASSLFFGLNAANAAYIDLGGNTLDVKIGVGKYLNMRSTEITDGTLEFSQVGWFVPGGESGVVATNGVEILFNSAIDSQWTAGTTTSEGRFAVGNIALLYDNASKVNNYGATPIAVYGTFKPTYATFRGCELQNGATLDFSGYTGTFPAESTFQNGVKEITYAAGAAVKVKTGDKNMSALAKSADPYLVKWAAGVQPDATFEFAEGERAAANGYTLAPDGEGLRVVPKPGFLIRISGGRDVKVSGEWMAANCEAFGTVATDELAAWLDAAGANGLPRWQSWILGLDPAKADSVILCTAGESAPEDGGEFTVDTNLEIPEYAETTVTAKLVRDGGFVCQTKEFTSGKVSLTGTLGGKSVATFSVCVTLP